MASSLDSPDLESLSIRNCCWWWLVGLLGRAACYSTLLEKKATLGGRRPSYLVIFGVVFFPPQRFQAGETTRIPQRHCRLAHGVSQRFIYIYFSVLLALCVVVFCNVIAHRSHGFPPIFFSARRLQFQSLRGLQVFLYILLCTCSLPGQRFLCLNIE